MRIAFPNCLVLFQARIKKNLTLLVTIATFNFAHGQANYDSMNWKKVSRDSNIKSKDRFQYSFKNANPKAKILMNEDFFWSPVEETAPFGNDDGSDAAYGFHEWRILNRTTDPVVFLKELIGGWNYPNFDLNELDTNKIKKYFEIEAVLDEPTMHSMKESLQEMFKKTGKEISDSEVEESIKASSKGMGRTYLLGIDNAIIGIGFAQLAIEGYIDNGLKQITIIAINRQLLPILILKYDEQYREIRKEQLRKMRYAIQQSS